MLRSFIIGGKMEKLMVLENIIRQLYAVDELQGYAEGEIHFLKELFGALPRVLEDFYRAAGNTEVIHHVQDSWMLPENFRKWKWLQTSDHMILLNENQGVCRAGIRREDLVLSDPPVYSTEDDKTWVICAPTTSEFLAAALAYESAFTFTYNPEEFYWLTGEEMEQIQSQLTKYPFELQSWISDMKITFYSNEPDNLVAVMDCGDLQMLYGAASEVSYSKLMDVMEGIGEPI